MSRRIPRRVTLVGRAAIPMPPADADRAVSTNDGGVLAPSVGMLVGITAATAAAYGLVTGLLYGGFDALQTGVFAVTFGVVYYAVTRYVDR